MRRKGGPTACLFSSLLTPYSSLLTGGTMTVKRLLLAAAVLAGVASAAWWSRQADWAGTANPCSKTRGTTGLKMTAAGAKFVALLTDEQKAAALFAFDDKDAPTGTSCRCKKTRSRSVKG